MARARNIKPGFFKNEVLAELHPLARILFIGLWTLADREGRLEDRPKRIKAECLPYDDCDVDAFLWDLHRAGFILRYEVSGGRYIQILKFKEHQSPHFKEPPSVIPAPEESSASLVQAPDQPSTSLVPALDKFGASLVQAPGKTGASMVPALDKTGASLRQAPDEHHTDPSDSGFLIPDSLKQRDIYVDFIDKSADADDALAQVAAASVDENQNHSAKGHEDERTPPSPPVGRGGNAEEPSSRSTKHSDSAAVQEVYDHYITVWRDVFPRGPILTPARRKKIASRLKTYSVDELKRAIEACHASPWMRGENEKGQPYGTIDYLMRSDEIVDRWLQVAEARVREPPKHGMSRWDIPDEPTSRVLTNSDIDRLIVEAQRKEGW